jgi:hypothetical protein
VSSAASQFTSDVQTLHSRGQKVILSVGGQNGAISVDDATSASNFASSVYSIIQQYGFDGVDIDLENGVNPAYMASALEQLESDAGPSLIITLAPQTVDTQSTGDDYFQLALNIKTILTMINTQYYNSGSMNGCDGNVYSEGTENFMTALACTEFQGGLSAAQIGLGLPASSSAAGSSLGGQRRAGLPGRAGQLRQLRPVGRLPGDPRGDDLVHQLGRVRRLQLRQHGGAVSGHAAMTRGPAPSSSRTPHQAPFHPVHPTPPPATKPSGWLTCPPRGSRPSRYSGTSGPAFRRRRSISWMAPWRSPWSARARA